MNKLLALLISGLFVTAACAQTAAPAKAEGAQSKEVVTAAEKKQAADKPAKESKAKKKKVKKDKSKSEAGKTDGVKAKSKKKEAGKDKAEAAKPVDDKKGAEVAK